MQLIQHLAVAGMTISLVGFIVCYLRLKKLYIQKFDLLNEMKNNELSAKQKVLDDMLSELSAWMKENAKLQLLQTETVKALEAKETQDKHIIFCGCGNYTYAHKDSDAYYCPKCRAATLYAKNQIVKF